MGKNYTRFARPICTPPPYSFHFFIYICTVLWLDIFYGEAVFNNCVCHGKRANKAERVQKKRWESNFNPWWNAKLLLPCIIDRLESLFSIRYGKRLCTTLATIENGTSQIDVVFVPSIHPRLSFDLSNISALSIDRYATHTRFHISRIITRLYLI